MNISKENPDALQDLDVIKTTTRFSNPFDNDKYIAVMNAPATKIVINNSPLTKDATLLAKIAPIINPGVTGFNSNQLTEFLK